MKLKVYKPIFILILFYHVAFINLPYIHAYDLYKYIMIAIVAFFLLLNLKTFRHNKFEKINGCLYFYVVMVLISSFINRNIDIERKVFLVAIIFVLTIIEGFLLFEFFIINNKITKLVNALFYLTLFYCLLADIVMLLFPSLHIEKGMYYLVGNKFEISYLHIQLLILYIQKENLKNCKCKIKGKDILFVILLLSCFCICVNVECTTGMIGVVLVFFFYYLVQRKGQTLKKPSVVMLILLMSVSILMLFSGVVQLEPVRYIVEDIFHKDITLTGRLNIYKSIGIVFSGHTLWGYGMGSSFEVMMKMIGAPNTQNGVLEIILQQGILSLIGLLILTWTVFKYISKKEDTNYALIKDIKDIVNNFLNVTLTIAVPATIGISFVSKEMVLLLFGQEFMPSISTIVILSPLIIMMPMSGGVLGQILLTSENEKKYLLCVSSGAMINCLLNFIFIPLLSHNGAAVASTLTEALVNIIMIYFSCRIIHLEIEGREIYKILCAAFIMGTVLMGLHYICHNMNIFCALIIKIMIAGFTYILCLLLMKQNIVTKIWKRLLN